MSSGEGWSFQKWLLKYRNFAQGDDIVTITTRTGICTLRLSHISALLEWKDGWFDIHMMSGSIFEADRLDE